MRSTNGPVPELKSNQWPTAAHTSAALSQFSDGLTAVDLIADAHYQHLVTPDASRDDGYWLRKGVPIPTYEDFGVMAEFIEHLKSDAADLQAWIERLEERREVAWLGGMAAGKAVA